MLKQELFKYSQNKIKFKIIFIIIRNIIKFDDKDDDFGEYTTKKTKEKEITRERKDKLKASKEIIKKEKNIDDFCSKKSSFLNPFKYLKKSFQKKQNEKKQIAQIN